MELKKQVIRYKKCLFCSNVTGFIARHENSEMSDKEILFIIANAGNKTDLIFCETCKMHCYHETVAWDYLKELKNE